jgi:antitoxin MazE
LTFFEVRNYNVITLGEERKNMRTELTRIGNSRGIRIPKPLIAQCGLEDIVELRVTAAGLVIAPHRSPRHGWKQAFAASREADDGLLLGHVQNTFDREDWKW